ncbi:potassium transporter TrkG [Oricola sp.]|uniref:potassium transporter TrkG n=1 Tax=Oricola sp. TaxID=1979950 RepID=UPI003BABE988
MFLASLAGPILVGIAHGESEQAIRLTIVCAVGVFISGICTAATLGYRHALTHTRLILTMVLVWLTMSAIGALPLYVAGNMPFGKALFESVSGLTTSGATLLTAREELPRSIIFWRVQLEWAGGFLTLASLFLVLSPLAIGGVPKRAIAADWQMVMDDGRDAGLEHLKRYFPLLVFYGAATLIVYFAFVASGAGSLDAAYLTMTGISTGGFSPYDVELELHHGVPTIAVMAIVLAVSATSIFWQRYDVSSLLQRLVNNREALWVFAIVGLMTLSYTVAFGAVSGWAPNWLSPSVIVDSAFAAASIVSTSGLESRPGVIALLPETLVFSVAFFGAAVFSTSSGLKVHRLGAMLVQSVRELSLLIYPSSITPTRIAGARYSENMLVEIWPVLVLLLAVMAIGVFALAGGTGSIESAIVAAMALVLNAAPLYDAFAPLGAAPDVWPQFRDFSAFEQLVAGVIMLLGRLEFIAVFAILNVKFWISR